MHIIHYLNAAWVDKAPWIQNCPQHFLFAIELMFGLPLGLDQFQKLPFSTDLNLLGEWLSTSNISFAQASLILAHQLCETNKQLSVHTVVGETHSIPAALSAFILKPQETYNCSGNLQLFMKLTTVHETYNCSWNLQLHETLQLFMKLTWANDRKKIWSLVLLSVGRGSSSPCFFTQFL